MTLASYRGWFGCVMAACLALAGCGGGDGKVTIRGKVTLDGQPLEQGAILFLPSPGNSGVATGGPIKNGRYELSGSSGVSVGKYSVQITSMRKSGEKVQAPFGPQGTMIEHEVSAIAPRFNTQSTLTFEVKPGDNSADFAVESK